MEVLDDILRRHTVSGSLTETDGKLLGAAFIVLKDHGSYFVANPEAYLLILQQRSSIPVPKGGKAWRRRLSHGKTTHLHGSPP